MLTAKNTLFAALDLFHGLLKDSHSQLNSDSSESVYCHCWSLIMQNVKRRHNSLFHKTLREEIVIIKHNILLFKIECDAFFISAFLSRVLISFGISRQNCCKTCTHYFTSGLEKISVFEISPHTWKCQFYEIHLQI